MGHRIKKTLLKKVTVDAEIIYSGNDIHPKGFLVNYSIDGKSVFKII